MLIEKEFPSVWSDQPIIVPNTRNNAEAPAKISFSFCCFFFGLLATCCALCCALACASSFGTTAARGGDTATLLAEVLRPAGMLTDVVPAPLAWKATDLSVEDWSVALSPESIAEIGEMAKRFGTSPGPYLLRTASAEIRFINLTNIFIFFVSEWA